MAEIKTDLLVQELKNYFEASEFQLQFQGLADKSLAEKVAWGLSVGVPLVAGVIEKIVLDLEHIGGATGEQKKAALVKFLDDVIQLPMLLEPFDGMIIEWTVDLIIAQWNRLHGHEWFNKIKDTLGIS